MTMKGVDIESYADVTKDKKMESFRKHNSNLVVGLTPIFTPIHGKAIRSFKKL